MIDKNKSTPEAEMENKKFPPKLSPCHKKILGVCYVLGFLGAIITIIELCFQTQVNNILTFLNLSDITCFSYLGIGFALTGLIIDRMIRYETRLHKSRSEDLSVVKCMIVEATTFKSKISPPGIKLEDFEGKKNQLSEEVLRLNKLINQDCCTEYQILPIQKMFVDFMSNDEVMASAQSTLADLQDYADDSSYRYDKDYYIKWKQRIDQAEKIITEHENNPESDSDKDNPSYKLRSELKALIEHVTEYKYTWTVGSELIRNLIICSAAAIPLLIVSGLIPVIHPTAPKPVEFGFFSWGFLGTSGSLTAVLLGLRRSDLVEVGNTEGKKELWRAIIGSVLGFVSGIIVYSLLDGGLISGDAVPDMTSGKIKDISLMVFWAIGAGFSFEKIFDRFRTFNTVDGSS